MATMGRILKWKRVLNCVAKNCYKEKHKTGHPNTSGAVPSSILSSSTRPQKTALSDKRVVCEPSLTTSLETLLVKWNDFRGTVLRNNYAIAAKFNYRTIFHNAISIQWFTVVKAKAFSISVSWYSGVKI